MGFFHANRQRIAIDSETVVHGNDFNLLGCMIFHRVIGAMMALMHFFGCCTQCQCQHLVTKADTENRQAAINQLFDQDRREAMIQAGYQEVTQYSWSNFTQQLKDSFN